MTALLDSGVWQGQIYSGGWVGAHGGDMPIVEPATGGELGRAGRADAADVATAAAAAAAAQPGLGGHELRGTGRGAAPGRRPHPGPGGRPAALGQPGDRRHRRPGRVRGRRGRPGVLRGGHAGVPADRRDPAQQPAAAEPAAPPAGRRGRRHLAVQRAADPVHPVDRAGARARQRGRGQARPAHAARRRLHPGPGAGGGRAAGRPAARTARRVRRRRGAHRRPAGPGHLLHRFDRDRPAGGRAGRAPPQAGPPRAGRQLGAGHPRRRRPRRGGLGRRVGLVPAPGPDLHDRRAAHRARAGRRRLRDRAGRARRATCRSATRPPGRSRSAR